MNSFLSKLSWRIATKSFDTTRKVSSDDLKQIKKAIHLSPSSFGLQPYYVREIDSEKNKDIAKELIIAGYNQDQFKTASHMFIFVIHTTDIEKRIHQYFDLSNQLHPDLYDKSLPYKQTIINQIKLLTPENLKAWANNQIYLALGFGLAACAELEIDSCPMEGFSTVDFDRILKLPSGHYSTVVMSVGYRNPNIFIRSKVRFPFKELFPDS